jgi:hypothetical protein
MLSICLTALHREKFTDSGRGSGMRISLGGAWPLSGKQHWGSAAFWDAPSRQKGKVTFETIPRFSARGMRRVYGRGLLIRRGEHYQMDLWLSLDGRLRARFWTRNRDKDNVSFEIFGQKNPPLRDVIAENEDWVPNCIRYEFESWVAEEGSYF